MPNKVKMLRQSKNISQQKCADQIGISKRTLQRYESGKIGNLEYYKKIANYFNVPIEEILPDSIYDKNN